MNTRITLIPGSYLQGFRSNWPGIQPGHWWFKVKPRMRTSAFRESSHMYARTLTQHLAPDIYSPTEYGWRLFVPSGQSWGLAAPSLVLVLLPISSPARTVIHIQWRDSVARAERYIWKASWSETRSSPDTSGVTRPHQAPFLSLLHRLPVIILSP